MSTLFVYVLLFGLLNALSYDGVAAFLFPGVRNTLRSGRTATMSRYKIGVLDESPFCLSNGTGYVVDLMTLISRVYRERRHNTDDILSDVVPVKLWQQLADKAHRDHWEVAFGLISTTLLRTDAAWHNWYVSSPVVATSIKILAPAKESDDSDQPSKHHHHQQHPHLVGHRAELESQPRQTKINLQAKLHKRSSKYTVVVTKDSDEERLLHRAARYRPQLHSVDSLDEGLNYVRRTNDSVIVTDATVADYYAEWSASRFKALCPSKRIHGTSSLFYGFFGKDKLFIDIINDVIERMSSDSSLAKLNARYFGHVVHC